MSDFNARVRHEHAMTVIALVGTIDGGAESALDRAYGECDVQGSSAVALDFDEVDYINSTGIALLVTLLAKAKRDGLPVRAWGLTDHYREIFEITRLADFLEVFADEQSARTATEPI
ncbi:MAG: STAS domain-containing protein [Microthrixaceae bacterium]